MGALSKAKTRVLDALQMADRSGLNVWHPRSSRKVEEGTDRKFEGVLVLAPRGPRQRLQHLKALRRPLPHLVHMVGEGEEGVEVDAQDFRVLVEGEEHAVEENLRAVIVFVRERREQRHFSFLGGDFELQISKPFGDDDKVGVERSFNVVDFTGRKDGKVVGKGGVVGLDERKAADVVVE